MNKTFNFKLMQDVQEKSAKIAQQDKMLKQTVKELEDLQKVLDTEIGRNKELLQAEQKYVTENGRLNKAISDLNEQLGGLVVKNDEKNQAVDECD